MSKHAIIVASLNGGYVVKRLMQVRETMFLLSDHPLVPPIVATAETGFQVWGVVLFRLHPLHSIVRSRLLQRQKKPGQ